MTDYQRISCIQNLLACLFDYDDREWEKLVLTLIKAITTGDNVTKTIVDAYQISPKSNYHVTEFELFVAQGKDLVSTTSTPIISAIKIYRNRTGLRLKICEDMIELAIKYGHCSFDPEPIIKHNQV